MGPRQIEYMEKVAQVASMLPDKPVYEDYKWTVNDIYAAQSTTSTYMNATTRKLVDTLAENATPAEEYIFVKKSEWLELKEMWEAINKVYGKSMTMAEFFSSVN